MKHNKPIRVVPYERHLFNADTSDSQEPGFHSGELSPCTPTDMIQSSIFKVPTVCPPTPIKTPTTQKKRREFNNRTQFLSSTPLFSNDTAAGGHDENNTLLRSAKIKRAAVAPSPAVKRKCSSTQKPMYHMAASSSSLIARSPLHPITTPFKKAQTGSFNDYLQKKRSGSAAKIFKALQFDEDEQDDNDDDDIVADDEDMVSPSTTSTSPVDGVGLGFKSPIFVHSLHDITQRESNKISALGDDMVDDEEPSSPIIAASPNRQIFSPQRNLFGSPTFTRAAPNIATPSSPDLFGNNGYCTSSDEELVSDEEEPEFEGFSDLATQTQMPGCTPPKLTQSNPFGPSPPRVPCRLTTETVHENPFSPERNIKPKARRSINMDVVDILSDVPTGKSPPKESDADKREQNDSYMMLGFFSRYLEDFTELATLGDGSFGKVTKCKNRLDGMCYAVKQTKKKIKGDKDKQIILKEVHALATLVDNPHIVRYFSSWIEDDRLFVQTELCEGGSWDSKIKNNYIFSEDELLDIMRQVATGLQQMHAQNIVHLDIKPENIYLTATGKYKIGDLGLAASSWAELRDVNEGDSRYLAKEILNNQNDDNELTKVDIFALGASLYESASRKPLPNNGDEWHEIRTGELKHISPQEYSNEFIELIKKMLHPDPKQRPTALDLIQHRLVLRRKLSYEELEKQVYVLEEMLRKQKETEQILLRQLDHLTPSQ